MVDTQLLNGTLLALAIIVGAAIALSITIVAVAGLTQRSKTRHAGTGQGGGPAGGTRRDLPPHPAPETGHDRTLVLH
jgi:hypothetical protein